MRRRGRRRVAALASLWLAVAACGSNGQARSLGAVVPPVSPESVDVTLFLIGDAGAPAPPPDSEPVLVALRTQAAAAANPVVAFLGDNVYPHGLPDSANPKRAEAERRLNAQVDVLRASGARGLFLPGNHDWDRQSAEGWDAVRRQDRYLAALRDPEVAFLPADGCPGPAVVDVGRTLRLVVLDTQWWLHGGAKPTDPTSSCPADSEPEVVSALRAALAGAGSRRVAVLGHHPLESGGHHGGHFGWGDHVFPLRALKKWLWVPLPVIGSAYPLARKTGVTNQDASGPAYRRMRAALETAFADDPPLVYAAGHDHNLQVLAGTSARYLVVSGAGVFGHRSWVSWRDSTRFAAQESGYMRLEILSDGRARLAVTVVDRTGRAEEAFSLWLD